MNTEYKLLALNFFPIGKQEPQYNSTYQFDLSGENLESIRKDVAMHSAIAAPTGAKLINMVPSKEQAFIPGDWSAERYSYVMIVEVVSQVAGKQKLVIRGFTKEAFLTEDTELFFNSSTTYVQRVMMTPSGRVDENVAISLNHVLVHYEDDKIEKELGRPTDVFAAVQVQYLENAFAPYGNNAIFDCRNRFKNMVVMSSLSNDVPGLYLETMLKNIESSEMLLGFGQGDDDLYSRARSMSYEDEDRSSRFLNFIGKTVGKAPEDTVSLKIKDLGVIGNYRELMSVGKPTIRPLDEATTLSLYDNQVESTLARMVGSALPRFMTAAGMESVTFSIDWDKNLHTYGVYVESAEGVLEVEDSTLKHMSIAMNNISIENYRRFHTEILQMFYRWLPLTNQAIAEIKVKASLAGEAVIAVKLNGNEYLTFIYPLFASSIVSPVIHHNRATLNHFANEFELLWNTYSTSKNVRGPVTTF